MSKIGVALALTVLLLGAVLVIGNNISAQVVDRGRDVGNALTNANLGVDETSGTVTITTP